ncbi:MAG: hypothetical protein KA144_10515 [Xanthomonadaceae bacterium]|nr:hypothetical protein [Xanthomonadaceae bacterium]
MSRRLALALLLPLAFASSHLLAKTSALVGNDDAVAEVDSVGGEAEEAPPSPKPAAKRAAQSAPAKAKPQTTQYRDQPNAKQAPRWHRFIPGMIR